MSRVYQPLEFRPLHGGAKLQHISPPRGRVRMSSPALEAMVDLSQIPAATIDPQAPLDAANRFMLRRGVRLLLVTDERRYVLGLITANDILGEPPLTFALERGLRRQDLLVRDIMTPRERLDVLHYPDVAHAQVGHIVASLKAVGRQHALVADSDPAGEDARPRDVVRGIFSLSQIAHQLGVSITSTEIAHTFSEIEAALGR